MPRSFLFFRERSAASGMAPIPSWRVAPSGTSEATFSPICRSTSPSLGDTSSTIGESHSTIQVRASRWILTPAVRGRTRLIGRSDLQQHFVDGQYLLLEEPWNFGEEAGSEHATTLLHGLSGGSAEKESVETKAAFHPWLGKGGGAHADHVHDFHVRKLRRARHQGLDERRRFTAGVPQHHAVSRLDSLQGLLGRNQLLFTSGSPVFQSEHLVLRDCRDFYAGGSLPNSTDFPISSAIVTNERKAPIE